MKIIRVNADVYVAEITAVDPITYLAVPHLGLSLAISLSSFDSVLIGCFCLFSLVSVRLSFVTLLVILLLSCKSIAMDLLPVGNDLLVEVVVLSEGREKD